MKRLLLTLLLPLLIGTYEAKANHIMGGEITWRCIKSGPNTGKFVFQLKFYRDCSGPTAPTDVTLTTNAPGTGGGIFCPLVSLTDITPVGPAGSSCPTCASPGAIGGVAAQEAIYESAPILISGVPPATGWYFWFNTCCRNGAITNLSNPTSYGFTFRAIMYPFNATNTNPCFDSSPSFAEKPQLTTCARNLTSYSHNAIDDEVDSLVYSWANPIDGGFPGSPVPWAGGYSTNSPMPGTSQNPLNQPATLDPGTGEVTFLSYTSGAFVSVTKVTAYKCNVKVAEVFREVQIVLLTNCIISGSGPTAVYNTAPSLAFSVDPTLHQPSSLTPFIDTVYAGDTVKFAVNAVDWELQQNGTSQHLTFSATGNQFGTGFTDPNAGCIIAPCAVISPAAALGTPVVGYGGFNFSWVTNCDHLGGGTFGCARLTSVYNFVIKVFDDFCPSHAVNFNSITIVVKSPPPVAAPLIKCANVNNDGTVNLSWIPPSDTGIIDTLKYFKAFYIWRASNRNGPYALIDSVFTLATSTYLDSKLGIDARTASYHYYMTARSGCEIQLIPNSDTISTMILQVSQVGTNGHLTWNHLYNNPGFATSPQLANANFPYSSLQKYYIWKEQTPAGSGLWSLIDSTTSNSYDDPVTVCNDSINYKISLNDTSLNSSFCSSFSNINGARLSSPAGLTSGPSLRCVNVTQPLADIQLSWVGTRDTASYFGGYNIYHATSLAGPYTKIGTVTNYATNSFTHLVGNGNSVLHYYYLTTIAGCDQLSAFENVTATSDTMSSIIVQATPTLGFATLTWNAQRNPLLATSTAQYRIFRKISPAIAWTLIGTTSSLTYQDAVVLCDTTISYCVDISDNSLPGFSCTSTSSVDQDRFTSLGDIIANPKIGCLDVQANGDVKLTWSQPADPFNFFAGYEIYHATNIAGPYTLVTTVAGYGTLTYSHAGANANNQVQYYYLRSLSGCTGLAFNGTSDTLATMLLSVTPTLGFADLSWNVMHTPMLSSTPGPYRIMRRPTGVGLFAQVGTSATTTFRDTIKVCNVPYEYRVELDDATVVCTSGSSADNDVFTYLGNVIESPALSCVSVLPSGAIALNWTIPTPASFTDFNEYEIWRNDGVTGWQLIDSVSTSASAGYTDALVNGNTQSYTYYVNTQSGCTGQVNAPAPSESVSSIYLTVTPTLGFADLSWNAQHVPNLPGAPGPYRIMRRSTGVGLYTQVGTSATTTFRDTIKVCNVPYEYTVELDNNLPCTSTSNAANDVFTYLGNVIESPALSCVSVLPSGAIALNWTIPTPLSFTDFNEYEIWRNDGVTGWQLIDSVSTSASAGYTDALVNGNTQSYTYYVNTQSGCTGQVNAPAPSESVSSIYLTVTPTLGFADLSWNAQHVPNLPGAPGPYRIMRRSTGVGLYTQVGTSATTTFRDTIKVCNVPYEYTVELDNNLPCTSTSNAANDVFTYLGNVIESPALSCVSVLPSGAIALNWTIPTPASFTDFNEYEIWRNDGVTGWQLIDSVSTSASAGYTDALVNGNTQSYTYYVNTQSGCTGQVNAPAPSESVSSIYLTVTPTLGFADLSWNAQHVPNLPGAPGPYRIMRRSTGVGLYTQVGTSATTTFRDTIKVCNVPYEYTVELDNNLPCTSTSNAANDVFTYIGNVIPDPRLRCASVLPTGEVELYWEGPITSDLTNFNQYDVWRNSGAGYTLIDSVEASNIYYYKDSKSGVNANAQSYSYYLLTKSGCTGQELDGSTSDTLSSIYLTATSSLGLASLNWNALHNPLPAAIEYIAYSTYPTGSLGILGDTLVLNYSEAIHNCDTSITHQIWVNDPSGCTSKSSVTTKVYTYIGNVIDNPELRCANVLPNGNVVVTWQNPVPSVWDNFNQYNIYRNNGSGFILRDSVEISGNNSYVDVTADGNAGAVSYYLVTKSGCTGQVDNGTTSLAFSTLFLKVTGAGNNIATLNWNAPGVALLPSSTGSYKIEKEFPGGSNNWTTVAPANLTTSYSETLNNICIDSINYRVSIGDGIGCVSNSNRDGEIFVDNSIPSPPILTCAKVQPDGSVMLNWIAPSDTAHQFNSYHVYYASNVNGPFNVVDSIFNYNTATSLITGINAQAGPAYFTIKTRSGCGPQYSAGSDTVKTITVNVINNNGVALVSWNPLNPSLVAPGITTYDLYKEYPTGTWKLLASLPDPTYEYKDTINVCQAVINYRIETTDPLGCRSVSSIDGELFKDLTKPYAALIDSVSLDPLNPSNVSLGWTPSTSGDAEGYIIYLFNGASWDSIGAVNGRNNTFFPHVNAAAAYAPQLYSISTFDSCLNVSSIGISHNTLFSAAKLDICRGAIDIKWNPYLNMVGGINHYNVFMSENGATYSLLATVPSNNISYSHTGLIKGSSYSYYVQAVGNVASRTSSSTISTEFANLLTEPTFSYLKKATVSDIRKVYVECLVDTANGPDVSRYKLQRSTDRNGPFTTVGVTLYTGQPVISFTDYTARTDEFSYFYRVLTIDSCGNEVLISNLGRTILLSGRGEFNLTNKLFWNDYEDWLGHVRGYSVYRKVDDLWQTIPVTNNIGFGFTEFIDDVSALYIGTSGRFCYRIEAYEDGGNPYGFADTSISNEFCLIQEPHLFVPNAFTPGGKNPIIKPEHVFIDTQNYFFAIYNRWGQKIFESHDPGKGWDGFYNGEIAPVGTYVYSVRIYGSNGKEIEKNGSFTLLK